MKKSFIFASLLYFVSVGILFSAVYHFLQWRHLSDLGFFVAGFLVLLVALGWWYVIASLIMHPQKRMEAELERLIDDIIHELNIPLSTIRANSELLKKKLDEDPRSLRRIERIEDASTRLERLYKELSYQIRKETKEIEKERFLLSDLIYERVGYFEAQGRNPLHVEIGEDMEITADRIGFEQMFDNLISNAMKYSPREKPVTITLISGKITIQDHGIGMDATELIRVMERYYQADQAKEGRGIGLALVKAYCDSEGIDIRIHSQKGKGTEVILDLGRLIAAPLTSA